MAVAFSGVAVPMLACALALPLAGCLRDPIVSSAGAVPSGNWRVERQTDRITGAPIASAFLTRRKSSHSGIAFAQPAQMQVGCFREAPIVRFGFEFKIGSNRNAEFGYRFDEKPGREIKARFVDDYKSVVIEDQALVAQFLAEMETSAQLYVRIRSLNAGRTAAEFRLDGAAAAIESAFAGCAASTDQPRRPPSS